MSFWLAGLCALLCAAAAVLLARLLTLQKNMDEMTRQLRERLDEDTNNPVFLSTRNAHARRLAAGLNRQLQEMRAARLRYESGDRALQAAVTNISHDLRTPLTAMRGYLELLRQEPLSENAARYIALIDGRAEAMTLLTEDLLRYSIVHGAQETLHPEPVDLNAALEESVAALYAALTRRGIRPEISLPQARVRCMADRTALARVFGNILNNALKYSGGDLAVSLTPDGAVVFSNAAPNLDSVQVGRLFDRFFTVESGDGSTGLGLSIARALTEQMGGSIRAAYRGGRLDITVRFPPCADSAAQPSARQHEPL